MQKQIRLLSLAIGWSAVLLLGLFRVITPAPLTHAASTSTASFGDVVINEVAWAGHASYTADEWIELYNTTAETVSVEGWHLYASDLGPTLTLQGDIGPHAYYLIERTDDNTVSDIPADWKGPFSGGGLHNNGEVLYLDDETDTRIDSANADGGGWPAGTDSSGSPTYATMERVDPLALDTDANWATNDGMTRNGEDAGGNLINGTPKAPNSCYSGPAQPMANLVVAKSAPATVTAGSPITYHLALSNTGALTASNVILTDTLPAALVDVASSRSPDVTTSHRLVWHLHDVPTQTTIQFTVTARVTTTATGALTNVLTATTPTTETQTGDNVAETTTMVESDAPPPPPPKVLIESVLYDGYQYDDLDEAFALYNPGDSPAVLHGWEVCKYGSSGYTCKALPDVTLAPLEKHWFARDATAFATSFGFSPTHEMSEWLGLANSGDELLLRDAEHAPVDGVVFEGGTRLSAIWSGPAVEPAKVGRAEGQILTRIPDEQTGLPIADTNTAADWIQDTANVTHGRRVHYPGWDFDILFHPLTATESATVVVGIAPDNAIRVVTETLLRARETISIEVYSLSNPTIISTLLAQAEAGVQVTVLLEGGQVATSTDDPGWQRELWACQELEARGGRCYFMIHETGDNIYNRYKFLHSKLIVVDDTWVALSSQNLSQSSLPADDKRNGTGGSRGVVVATNAPAMVDRAAQIFALDCDPAAHNDILRWNTGYTDQYGPPSIDPDLTTPDPITYTIHFPEPLTVHDVFGFELFTAPEAALRQRDALLGLVGHAGAGDRVLVEQMYEYADWGEDPATDPNLRLEAYLDAARRGAEVTILLNRGTFGKPFGDPGAYTPTLAYVQQIAAAEGLDNLRIAAGDPTGYAIHNKMVLVDLGDAHYAHVGSINGSETSSKLNREVALQLENEEVFTYLEAMFLADWHLSHPVYLPLTLRNYEPPVDHLVFSEIYYITSDPNEEWAEIYNPTNQTVDIGGYLIGDAVNPDDYEGMYRFPANAQIPARSVVVVAMSSANVLEADFEIQDDSPTVPNLEPLADWGENVWTLANGGDELLFLDPQYRPIDVVTWGTGSYPGVVPHPGVTFPHSLERYPPNQDSDDCAIDFRERSAPTPGELPPEPWE